LRVSENIARLADVLVQREPAGAHEDVRRHFAFLAHALEFGRPQLFERYAAWCKPMLAHRGVPPAAFSRQLDAMALAIEEMVPAREARVAMQFVRGARGAVAQVPESIDSALGAIPPDAKAYLARLLESDTEGARRYARGILHDAGGLADLYLKVLAPAMKEVGLLWQANRISVAQEHYCAGVTQMVMGDAGNFVRGVSGGRTAVVACVTGEQHSMGSRMVADLLDLTGWRTLWLGASTPGGDLLRMVVEQEADLLALSCSHAPCVHDVATLVTSLRVLPECRHVKVLVGGYAFDSSAELWRDVGADAYAADAAAATQVAHRLVPQA
jgi:methanogenic corrinoid protein MtbC1